MLPVLGVAVNVNTAGLHPLIAQVIVDHSKILAPLPEPALFHPGVGDKRRSYQSIGGAFAYEAGYLAYCRGDQPPQFKTPFADGWNDAARDHQAGDEVAA